MDGNRLSEHVILAYEFDEWQSRNPGRIFCEGRNITEDGRLVFDLSINETKFRLLCPSDYPNHEDSFFVETECTDFWCVALNEFIVDYRGKLTLDDILAKTFLYYTPSSRNKSYDFCETDESENEDDRCCGYSTDDSESSENAEWEFVISKKKKEWREKEGELRLKYNRPKISDMFDGITTEHPRQVFSNSAASAILINDLINIMGSKDSIGIVVEPVESDICRWSVRLEKFNPDSEMAKHLIQVKESYEYEYVQLRLDFAMDLYPSHPPLIRLVKPKLIGVFDGEEFVKLDNWNPARDMASVLKEIKKYIETNGAVDIDDNRNGVNIKKLKNVLSELAEALKSESKKGSDDANLQSTDTGTERSTRMSSKYRRSSGFSINSRKEKVVIETILKNLLYELKNVGKRNLENFYIKAERAPATYSYFNFNLSVNDNFFNEKKNIIQSTSKSSTSYYSLILKGVNRLLENDKFKTQTRCVSYRKTNIGECGKEYCNIIENPSFEFDYRSENKLGFNIDKYSVENSSVDEVFYDLSTTRVISDYSDKSEIKKNLLIKRANDVISTFNVNIKNSEGLPVTTSSNNSTLGLNENTCCVSKSLKESNLLSLIRSKMEADGFFEIWLTTSLHSIIIEILIEIARNPYLIDLLKPTDTKNQSIPDLVQFQAENVTLVFTILSDITDGHTIKQADIDKIELAKSIIDASKFLVSKIETTNNHWSKKSNDKILSDKYNPNFDNHLLNRMNYSPEFIYKNSLKYLQFRNCDIDPETHAFKNEYNAEISSARNYFQIAQEFAFLSKILPLSLTPTIFVIMDSSKCSLMRALIIGAEGTRCSGGCFTFDIYLRKDYPDCSMEINCTTFRGEESIEQPEGETILLPFSSDDFDPDPSFSNMEYSTILKTLTLIRDQKLIDFIHFNYRRSLENLTEIIDGNSDKLILTNIIQFSMIDQMRNPSAGFEEIIKIHFRLKKDQIISELNDRYDSLKNSEILRVLIKEFDRLKSVTNCSNSIEKKSKPYSI